MQPLVTLLTDFGSQDSYVGVMKGVILTICPDVTIVDISHHVPPQDVMGAMLMLPSYVPYFPHHAVHLVVVDPGVGSERRPIACQTPLGTLVGPDNGVFSLIKQQIRHAYGGDAVRTVTLTEPRFWRERVSNTFHGRDIFAPVAAYLASGMPIARLGTPYSSSVTLNVPAPQWDGAQQVVGEVLAVDHFGNCITNITVADLERLATHGTPRVHVQQQDLPVAETYTHADAGTLLALVGSNDYLEIAVREGSASAMLGIGRGAPVTVTAQR